MVVRDAQLDGISLAEAVAALAGDRERRQAMGRAARELARPDATQRIVEIAERLIDGRMEGERDVP